MKILKLEEYKSSAFAIGETVILQNVIAYDTRIWNGKDCIITHLLSNMNADHTYNKRPECIPAGCYGVLFEGRVYKANYNQIRKK